MSGFQFLLFFLKHPKYEQIIQNPPFFKRQKLSIYFHFSFIGADFVQSAVPARITNKIHN